MAFSLLLQYSLLSCINPSQLLEGEKCVCPFVFLRPVYDSIKLGMVECALMKTYICANGRGKKRDYIMWGWICACLHTFLKAWRAKIKMSPWKAVQCCGWSLILLERVRLGEAWASTLRCVGRRIRCNVGDEISSDRWSIYSSERFAKPSQIDMEAVSTVGWFSTLLPITGRMLQVEIARKKRKNQVCQVFNLFCFITNLHTVVFLIIVVMQPT